ncbi:hypothetical protein B7494_g4368 [Chlorociboria aeruginascens]|nr:hypothetical protein B7494_g4368 [Chlorociboria aeruginascens]
MTLVLGGLANEFNNHQDASALRARIDSEVLYLVYLFIGQWVLTCLYGILLSISAMQYSTGLRAAYLKSAIRQDVGLISQGKVADDLASNISTIEDALSEKLGIVMQAGSTIVVSVIIAFVHSWQLSLALLSTIVLLLFSNFGTAALETRYQRQIQEVDEEAASLAEECLSGIRIVMSCVAESKLVEKYAAFLRKSKAKRIRKSPILGVQYSMSYFALLASYGLAFWYGTILLGQGKIGNGGTIVMYYHCLSLTINCNPTIDPLDSNGLIIENLKGDIELQNIDFSYSARSSVKVLDNLSIKFEAGKTTALVGASGSGKSTIVGLLERWYSPSQGAILIDGCSIETMNVKFLRSSIGLVQQDMTLFSDSVFYNIACGLFGTPSETLPEKERRALVIKSCIEVGAHSFIEGLPDGYDTKVGERGDRLSGGQKQRICIARAIISSPKILIFDEATSALDVKSEHIVEIAIKRASRNRTTIIIAHKLSFVQRSDKIVLLKSGQVIEEGTHESLLAQNGKYSRFWEAQELDNTTQADARDTTESVKVRKEEGSSFSDEENVLSATISTNAEDTSTPEPGMSLVKCSYAILKEHKALQWLFIALLPTCVVAGAVYPAQAIIFGNSVASFNNIDANIQHNEDFWSLMWFITALATLVAFLIMGILSSIMGTIAKFSYQTDYFNSILQQAPQFFDQEDHSSGTLVASLSLHPDHIHNLFNVLGFLLVSVVSITSCSILALSIQWRLALVGLFGSLPVIIFAGYLRVRSGAKKSKSLSEPLLNSAQYASEVIGAVRTVAALTMEQEVCQQLDKKMRESLPLFYRNIGLTMPLFAFSESGSFLGMALIFWYGGNLLADGHLTSSQLWIIFLSVFSSGEGAGEFFASSSSIFHAKQAINTIFDLRSNARTKSKQLAGKIRDDVKEQVSANLIAFHHANFSYPNAPNRRVLDNVSFSVNRGERLAIVGPSGSGKSTIIALLEKFYHLNSGSITIGPYPLEAFDTAAYRNSASLVSQDTILFQGTLRENILLGISEMDSTDERLETAARDANIHEFIASLPEGYNTQCGNKGIAFSGGQRQRIAIARAIVRRPAILLLDEATSALDSLNEIEVLEALQRASKETTTVTVAHRLTTIKNSDFILVLVKGRIAESGTHTSLMEKKGAYWAMCKAQALNREYL